MAHNIRRAILAPPALPLAETKREEEERMTDSEEDGRMKEKAEKEARVVPSETTR